MVAADIRLYRPQEIQLFEHLDPPFRMLPDLFKDFRVGGDVRVVEHPVRESDFTDIV